MLSLLAAAVPPSLDAVQDFSPSSQNIFVNPGTQASSEVIDHWFFTNAIPDWISYLITFAAGAAILMIVIGGIMLMIHPEQEDMKERGQKTIIWSVAGLIISVLAYTIVEIVNRIPFISGNPNTDLNINETDEIQNLASGNLRGELIPEAIQLILQIMGTLALVLFLYAGVLYVIRDGEEEKTTKARNLMIWAFVGMAVSLLAYIVVEGVINLNFERG